jgi:hypothetical protein
MVYIQPELLLEKFTCPHCEAIAHMVWNGRDVDFRHSGNDENNILKVARCSNCCGSTIWLEDKMLYPDRASAQPPNSDMPDSVLKLYEEAATISSKSPRAAAALLRLAIQVLCKELGEEGKNVNKDIGSLVSKGLPPMVQKSLDIVRVTGNNAVHPGQMDTDDEKTVSDLFKLINVIVEYMISLPKQVENLYEDLPSEAKGQIEERDS